MKSFHTTILLPGEKVLLMRKKLSNGDFSRWGTTACATFPDDIPPEKALKKLLSGFIGKETSNLGKGRIVGSLKVGETTRDIAIHMIKVNGELILNSKSSDEYNILSASELKEDMSKHSIVKYTDASISIIDDILKEAFKEE